MYSVQPEVDLQILFLSLVLDEEGVRRHPAASCAASEWVKGFCGGLVANGVSVATLGHLPARLWPLEFCLRPDKDVLPEIGFPQRMVRYWNLPGIRNGSLANGYRRGIKKHLADVKDDLCLCTYNPLPWQIAAGEHAVENGGRWFSFVLDEDRVATEGWNGYLHRTRRASGHVFVSQWAYDHAPVERKLLLEGGVAQWQGGKAERSDVPSLLYCGSLNEYAGVSELIALVECLSSENIEFWIVGKGGDVRLRRLAQKDNRVRLTGFLSEAELDIHLRRAWVAVLPRLRSHSGAMMNFPSKLLKYLNYGKPVVGMLTPGVPDAYRAFVFDARDVNEMAVEIERCLEWPAERFADRDLEVFRFLHPARTWKTRCGDFIRFVGARG